MSRNRIWVCASAALFAVLLTSCGGGHSVLPMEPPASGRLTYAARPTDGSVFELNLEDAEGTSWTGNYSDSSNESTEGGFSGLLEGNQLTLYCENLDSTTFWLTGTRQGNGHFQLTRSDRPGVTYDFAPVPQTAPKGTRIPLTFTFAMKGFGERGIKHSGRVFLYGTPTVPGGNIYDGVWQGRDCSVMIINSTSLAVFLYLGSDVVNATFRMSASQLGSITKDADNGYANIGNAANYPGVGRPSFSLPPPTISP